MSFWKKKKKMKKISFGLSVGEIKQAQKQIQEYQNDLTRKCELFCKRMAQEGIVFAKVYIGTSGFGKYVSFTSEIEPEKAGCQAIIIAQNTGLIKSEWRTKEGVKSADVSPILMLEFGSGLKAQNPAGIPGVGTGTFPGGSHGSDPSGWWYMDLDGVWHHSTGIEPKMPMYRTAQELRSKALKIAREVFGSG